MPKPHFQIRRQAKQVKIATTLIQFTYHQSSLPILLFCLATPFLFWIAQELYFQFVLFQPIFLPDQSRVSYKSLYISGSSKKALRSSLLSEPNYGRDQFTYAFYEL